MKFNKRRNSTSFSDHLKHPYLAFHRWHSWSSDRVLQLSAVWCLCRFCFLNRRVTLHMDNHVKVLDALHIYLSPFRHQPSTLSSNWSPEAELSKAWCFPKPHQWCNETTVWRLLSYSWVLVLAQVVSGGPGPRAQVISMNNFWVFPWYLLVSAYGDSQKSSALLLVFPVYWLIS